MEEDTQASSEEVPVKLLDVEKKERNKEDDEEAALDGEFIKVEKESIDSSHSHKTMKEEQSASEVSLSNSISITDSAEAHEKIKELKLELENVSLELHRSESEKFQLQAVVDVANEKLEKSDKQCKGLELDLKRMKEEITESELMYNTQLESLREALREQELKHKELIDVKESFDGLSDELEFSRKRMEKLEQDLLSSAGEAQKFAELSKERGAHADIESTRALEFEKILEVSKFRTKEMEDQMESMQEELKRLYDKITENQNINEALNSVTLELSGVQEELELSKSQVSGLEQKVVSDKSIIQDLKEELNLHKASEEQLREDILSLESLFSASKEDLQAKNYNLEEMNLKFQEELKARETAEAALKDQEIQLVSLQEQLIYVTTEKEALEASLTNNSELEQKLKSLEDLHQESSIAAETASQKNLDLEDLVRASNASEKEAKAQLKETEVKLITAEKRGAELEQQLNFAELKCRDADREIKHLQEKTSEVTSMLRGIEEENALSKCHFQAYEDRVNQLESSLKKSSSRNRELEQELHDLSEKCAEHENRASTSHQRSLELHDIIQASNSKAEDARGKVGELEILLETTNYQLRELEEQSRVADMKYRDAETELKRYGEQVSELSAELDSFQVKASSLEIALQSANEKEMELTDLLTVTMEERKRFEDLSNRTGEKLFEVENLLEVLQTELTSTQDELKSLGKDLKASGVRESEILEKLKSAEDQLEHQGKVVHQATARSLELESLHEASTKDSELKLQEALLSLTQKDSETKQLYEKLKAIEEHAAFYQDQAAEATEKASLLKAEIDASSINLVSLEKMIDELEGKVIAAEKKAEQSSSKGEMLAQENSILKVELEAHQFKVNELHEVLSSIHAEKEATAKLLDTHVKTITELTDQHSRGLEFQSVTESRINETEVQLREAIEKFTEKDSEAKYLNEKLHTLIDQVKNYEGQFIEAAAASETQKVELEEALVKIKSLEGVVEEMQRKGRQIEAENEHLAEANLNLTQELAEYETKMNELKATLNTVLADKDETLGQLHSSRKTVEDLIQQVASEGERLQSQISSVMEENDTLNRMHQDAKRELQEVTVQMEEQLNKQMGKENSLVADLEGLKAEVLVKSDMQSRIAELEQKLLFTETQFKEEIESIRSKAAENEAELTSKLSENVGKDQEINVLHENLTQLQKELQLAHTVITEQKQAELRKEMEREDTVKKSIEEISVKHQRVVFLEQHVEVLEQKLQIAEAQYKEKSKGEVTEAEAKDGLEVKSRDLGDITTTPSKRKSKKRSERSQQSAEVTSTNPATTTTTSEPSVAMPYKFILGVALVSIIIGIILGKRY